ncbi:MAG: DUF4868 domain-containing protein [Oscillospiraceae bacterium]|jgi:hypothetical protein|nr:DUF4868 domain-containing protein [Oscillospiraceae bacterium]
MFKNSSIMVFLNDDNENPVQLLEIDKNTQNAICRSFADSATPLLTAEQVEEFDGNWKPNEDEILSINHFNLPDAITNAIRNPLGLQTFAYKKGEEPDIRAVFVGERKETDNTEVFTIAFQRFRKEQYISTKKFSLFYDKETFKLENRWGIGITEYVDCVFVQTQLRFSSYYYARQVFDLSEYYRSATDSEVLNFSTLDVLSIADKKQFNLMADTWIRRKIAAINDSGVLKNNNAIKIKKVAQSCGFDVLVENKKLVMPTEKKRLKEVLGFLDDEVYKGAFSEETYITNSKRRVK